jgi:hypothetical protein
VYVPYCFLYPEKLTKIRGKVVGSREMGKTKVLDGDRCDIITDLDFNHFLKFLQDYIR